MTLNNIINVTFTFIKKYIVDIIVLILFIITIYNLWSAYVYEKEHENSFITKAGDFDYNIPKYENSELYHKFSSLSSYDKEFVNDYIIYVYLNNKENKPDFNKKLKLARNQLILTTICASYLLDASFIKSFRQNMLAYFIANVF